jgi:hypothetical protein
MSDGKTAISAEQRRPGISEVQVAHEGFQPGPFRTIADEHGFHVDSLQDDRHRPDEVFHAVLLEEPPRHDQAAASVAWLRQRRFYRTEERRLDSVGERLDVDAGRDRLTDCGDLTARCQVVVCGFQETAEDRSPERGPGSLKEVTRVIGRDDRDPASSARDHAGKHRSDVLSVQDVGFRGEAAEPGHREEGVSCPAGAVSGR